MSRPQERTQSNRTLATVAVNLKVVMRSDSAETTNGGRGGESGTGTTEHRSMRSAAETRRRPGDVVYCLLSLTADSPLEQWLAAVIITYSTEVQRRAAAADKLNWFRPVTNRESQQVPSALSIVYPSIFTCTSMAKDLWRCLIVAPPFNFNLHMERDRWPKRAVSRDKMVNA
jgi:hypothetical protein